MYTQDEPKKAVKVCYRRNRFSRHILTKLTDLLPGGRCVETLDTPEHPTPTGYYDHSLPAHFKLDVGWGPAGLH
jgi:hypothetical protein